MTTVRILYFAYYEVRHTCLTMHVLYIQCFAMSASHNYCFVITACSYTCFALYATVRIMYIAYYEVRRTCTTIFARCTTCFAMCCMHNYCCAIILIYSLSSTSHGMHMHSTPQTLSGVHACGIERTSSGSPSMVDETLTACGAISCVQCKQVLQGGLRNALALRLISAVMRWRRSKTNTLTWTSQGSTGWRMKAVAEQHPPGSCLCGRLRQHW